MANRRLWKVRILLIERMLSKEKFLSARDIARKLEKQYDIRVDRKTIMDDLMEIDRLIPLEVKTGRYGGYRIMKFE